MYKLNFVSNPRIMLFADGTEHEDGTYLTPDQIPDIIIPGLYDAIGDELILSLCIFAKKKYENYVRITAELWDGVITSKQMYKIFGDGSSIGAVDDNGKRIYAML